MKKSLLLLSITALSACTTLGEVEKEALRDRAIADAKKQPKEVHLAYLQCYGLSDSDKKSCRRSAKHTIEGRKSAVTWDYILPFDYEAERLGFKAFLQDQGKKCAGVNEGPKYNTDSNAYDVICTDGNQYQMRFDGSASTWELVK
ncbi:MAG: hypothetical protein CMM94_03100 [Rickettsiales bacterium]|nr:hypothetical protein [Rickettsiales bacterium]